MKRNKKESRKCIDNFVVITRRIREKFAGLLKYLNYLECPNVVSHRDTNIIKFGTDKDEFFKKVSLAVLDYESRNASKGGRQFESYAQSFVFSLPSGFDQPTSQQWKAIAKDLIRKAHCILAPTVDLPTFAQWCYVNSHNQHNPHLNLVITRVIGNERLKKLDQKAVLSGLKNQFNASVLAYLGHDYKAYKPEYTGYGDRDPAAIALEKRLKREKEDARKASDRALANTLLAQQAADAARAEIARSKEAEKLLQKASAEAEKNARLLDTMQDAESKRKRVSPVQSDTFDTDTDDRILRDIEEALKNKKANSTEENKKINRRWKPNL